RGCAVVGFCRLSKLLVAVTPKIRDHRMFLRSDRARLALIGRGQWIVSVKKGEPLPKKAEPHVLCRQVQNAIRIVRKLNEVGVSRFILKKVAEGEARQ